MTTLSGLASGIDTTTLVNQLVTVERQPISRLQSARSAKASQANQVQALTDKLRNLQKLAQNLEAADKANAMTASASDASVAVTATGAAAAGSYSIRVAELARAQRTYSDGFAQKTTAGAVGTGTISVTVGSAAAVDVSVTASDTLETVAQKLSQVAGITSSVIFDGSNYRLQVAGAATGAANAVTFAEQGTTLGLAKPENQIMAARDAKISIDGFTVTSASNTVSEAVPGLTIQLKAVTAGATYDQQAHTISGGVATEVSVASDTAALKTKVKDLVAAINDVNKDVKAFSTSQKSADAGIQSVTSRLRAVIGAPVSGLDQTMSALSQIGIATNRDGTLSINDSKLDALLSAKATSVVRLFSTSGATTGVASRIDDAVDAFVNSTSGTLVAKKKSMDDSVTQMDKRLDLMNRALDKYQTRVQKQFSDMEQAITKLNQAANVIATKA